MFMFVVPPLTSSVEQPDAVALKTTLQIPLEANAVANSIKASGTPPDRIALLLAKPLFGVVQIRVTRETWNPLVGAALATFGVTHKPPVLNHAW